MVSAVRAVYQRLEPRQMLSASHHPAGWSVSLDDGSLNIYGTNKSDAIVLNSDATGHLSLALNGTTQSIDTTAKLASIHIFGLAGNDSISVNTAKALSLPLTIDGGAGNNVITGTPGNDVLIGGAGNDFIAGGDGDDMIFGGKGNDRLVGNGGNDHLVLGGGRNVYNAGGQAGDTVDTAHSKGTLAAQAASAPRATPQDFFGTRTTGITPRQIRSAYGFGNIDDPNFTNRGAGQAIAVVVPYNTQNLTTSLATYSTEFGLPAPDTSNFQFVTATGTTPPADPDPSHGWEAEAATDVELIHGIAPDAKIYVVLANSDLFPDLFVAVDKAVDTLVANNGGGVVVMTAGSQNGEVNPNLEANFDQSFTRAAAQNVSFVSGAGDISGRVSYPAISPYVLSVGGTSLGFNPNGTFAFTETAWGNTGGGVSTNYPAPAYETAAGLAFANRTNPDVAYNADPNSGMAVFDATTFGDVTGDGTADSGWIPGGVGGTSAARPSGAP